MKIEGKVTGLLDQKRFMLPGVKIKKECPVCKQELVFDGNFEYLSYPSTEKTNNVYLYCEPCDEQVIVKIKVEVVLTEA